MLRRLLLVACWLAPACVGAATFTGVVSHVSDGDSLWVRPAGGGAALEVRVTGIDAPESCQPWGPQARQALVRRLLHRPVRVHTSGRDDYHRVLGRVEWAGQDVGRWLVRNGLAWSYRYRRQPGAYDAEQAEARRARRGLWSDAQPLEPRVFRRRHGSCPAG